MLKTIYLNLKTQETLYLDCGDGYTTIFICQNSPSVHLKLVKLVIQCSSANGWMGDSLSR